MPDAPVKRAAIYARISKRNPKVAKVSQQVAQCRSLATRQGYAVDESLIFRDDGISATNKKMKRPGWEALLDAIISGRVDVVVAVDEDRLARDPDVDIKDLQLACMDAGASWHTITAGAVNPANENDEFMTSVRAAVNRLEMRKKGGKQRRQNLADRQDGKPRKLTKRPFGFEDDGVTLRPAESQLIAEATRLVLDTGTLWPVVKGWNRLGVRTINGKDWAYSSVQNVLSRWRNAGWTESYGEPVAPFAPGPDGKPRPTIVSKADVEAVRAILTDPSRHTSKSYEPVSLCSGIATCICGATHVAAEMNGHPGYRCGARVRGWAKEGVHTSIRRAQLDPMARAAVVDYYAEHVQDGLVAAAEATEIGKLRGQLAVVEQGLRNLADSIAATILTPAEAAPASKRLREQQTALTAAIDVHVKASAHAAMLNRAAEYFRRHLHEKGTATGVRAALGDAFDALDLTGQRRLVKTLCTIVVGPGRSTDRVSIDVAGGV